MKKVDGRAAKVDMSSAAIDRRLREAAEMRRLCLSLAGARRIGPASEYRDDFRQS